MIYTNCRRISTLMSLFLNWIFISAKIKPNGLVGWSSLKRLCIGFAAMSEDVINKVLMGSPILEFLKLQNCYKFSRFDTLSESLRKLVMDTCISKVKLQC